MSARECPCQYSGRWQRCDACDGTGKVHPSVEGEIVVECESWSVSGRWILPERGTVIVVPGPGRYHVIVQKVAVKP